MVLTGLERDKHGVALGVRITGNRLAQLFGPMGVGITALAIGIGPALTLLGTLMGSVLLVMRLREQRLVGDDGAK